MKIFRLNIKINIYSFFVFCIVITASAFDTTSNFLAFMIRVVGVTIARVPSFIVSFCLPTTFLITFILSFLCDLILPSIPPTVAGVLQATLHAFPHLACKILFFSPVTISITLWTFNTCITSISRISSPVTVTPVMRLLFCADKVWLLFFWAVFMIRVVSPCKQQINTNMINGRLTCPPTRLPAPRILVTCELYVHSMSPFSSTFSILPIGPPRDLRNTFSSHSSHFSFEHSPLVDDIVHPPLAFVMMIEEVALLVLEDRVSLRVELETKVCEKSWTTIGPSPSWKSLPTSAFTFLTLCWKLIVLYDNWAYWGGLPSVSRLLTVFQLLFSIIS